MHEVVWSETALVQVDIIGAYIEQFNPMAAREVATALIKAGDSLASFPHRGRAVPATAMRELVIAAYPYVIRYRIVRDTVRILRVRHMRIPIQGGHRFRFDGGQRSNMIPATIPI